MAHPPILQSGIASASVFDHHVHRRRRVCQTAIHGHGYSKDNSIGAGKLNGGDVWMVEFLGPKERKLPPLGREIPIAVYD
jgi:hypothetical protein